jgi:hypothetical protein
VISDRQQEVGTLAISDSGREFIFKDHRKCVFAKVRVFYPGDNESRPRMVRFIGYDSDGSEELQLRNMKPQILDNGERGLYFGGKLTIKSAKNAILIDNAGSAVIGIRKITKDILEIDALSAVSPLQALAAAMSAWLGP